MAPRFISGVPIETRKIGATGRHFEVLTPLVYESAVEGVGRFTVPAGFVTNFHSIPIPFRNLFDPTDYAESGVCHDWLYEQGAIPTLLGYRPITRGQADQVHREILRLMGAPGWKVNTMYIGLRLGGWKAWSDYRERDAQRRMEARLRG